MFNNFSDLQKYLASNEGQQHIVKNSDIKEKLEVAAKQLHDILKEELEKMYASYTPVIYHRTYDLLNSLRITPVIQSEGYIGVTVYFDDDLAMHPSLFGGEDGDAVTLTNQGWQWSNDIGIHRLSFYEGFHFIESSIKRFEAENEFGFKVSRTEED